MPDVETVRGIARSKLGASSRILTGECRMLARLLADDEPILAMALAQVRGGPWGTRGRVVVATPLRVLLVGKAMITRHERVRDIPMASIRGARAKPPGSLEIELEDEVLRLAYAMPPRQLAALVDAVRGGRDPNRFETLDELARRKLGRFAAYSYDASLMALAQELAPEEDVVDLGLWTGSPGGIVAACDSRLVAIPDKGLGTGEPISIAYDQIVEIRVEGTGLVVRTEEAEHRFDELAPVDRASVIATRIDARVARAAERGRQRFMPGPLPPRA